MIYKSSSSQGTKEFAADLAKKILSEGPSPKQATVLALKGDLGAGKTTFTQGFFKGLGVKRIPNSPTFILMKRTPLRGKKFKNVFHIDAYRLKDPKGMQDLGLPELLREPTNLFLIEWPERIASLLPKKKVVISFAHGKDMDQRKIHLKT
jgi:tRNA threonylcarbamoyladenosine biosynthesis protein TsaE